MFENDYQKSSCAWTATPLSRADAITYCTGLPLASKTWRLPNRNELQSLVDYTKASCAKIDTTAFPNTQSSGYWSSSTYASAASHAWYVYFDRGYVYGYNKSGNYYVRCVSGL